MTQPLTLSSLLKLNNTSIKDVTSIGSASAEDMVLISSATASASASIEFSLGSYKEYKFFFVNMHPSSDNQSFQFQCSTDGGSTYGVTVTTTYFRNQYNESGSNSSLTYLTTDDLAQSTNFITISEDVGADNDQAVSGHLSLFNPSSTTYVKHFINNFSGNQFNDFSFNEFMAGYFNDTNDLTNIKFQFASGNIDDGKILMFGIN